MPARRGRRSSRSAHHRGQARAAPYRSPDSGALRAIRRSQSSGRASLQVLGVRISIPLTPIAGRANDGAHSGAGRWNHEGPSRWLAISTRARPPCASFRWTPRCRHHRRLAEEEDPSSACRRFDVVSTGENNSAPAHAGPLANRAGCFDVLSVRLLVIAGGDLGAGQAARGRRIAHGRRARTAPTAAPSPTGSQRQ